MNAATLITTYLLTASLAGLAGAAAMSLVMRLIARAGEGGDMVEALGSLLTRSLDNARMVGRLLHVLSAIGFGLVYALLMIALGLTVWPHALFTGLGFGAFHGVVVSLGLVWVVADNHPVERYRRSSPTVFLAHFAGHLAYGAVVGLVVALSPL